MAKCKSCGSEGSYKYDIVGWFQDLADKIMIDKTTDKCFSCLNKEKS